jgi:tetratricopeptide (TPR) repeat protein
MLSSCKKYLDQNPDSSVAVPTSLADLQALLDNSQVMNLQTTPSFGEASCDDYFMLDDTYNSFTNAGQTIYTWNRTPYNFQNDWSIAYQPVYVSNYCLDGLDKIPVTAVNQSNWSKVRGSALFYRSYNFLNLLWVYAKAYDKNTASSDLGIVLRLHSDFNEPSKRASVQACYDQVIRDTKAAADYLPEIPEHVMQPSKPAAYGLLARTYLSMREYDSALKYSNLCLNLKSSLIDFNGDDDIRSSISRRNPFKRFNKETIFYTEMTTVNAINIPLYANVDSVLYDSYDPTDLRKIAYYRPNSGYYQFKASYTAKSYIYFTGIATDEMYLIRAESYARTGNITGAMNDLNTLLIKRWDNTVPYPVVTATDANDAINKILDHRRKELHMRGVRWIDIKRLNKENRNIILKRIIAGKTYTLLPNDKYYALPLPADIVNITGIPQN